MFWGEGTSTSSLWGWLCHYVLELIKLYVVKSEFYRV